MKNNAERDLIIVTFCDYIIALMVILFISLIQQAAIVYDGTINITLLFTACTMQNLQ